MGSWVVRMDEWWQFLRDGDGMSVNENPLPVWALLDSHIPEYLQ